MINNKLRRVIFSLGPEWEKEEEEFRRRLAREGILCGSFSEAELPFIKKSGDTVILTDSPETGAKLACEGLVCFGCCHDQRNEQKRIREKSSADASDLPETHEAACAEETEVWFDGAALVLEGFEEVDAEYLEEWMLRAKGQPVTIARTERLVVREIADEDIPELERIGGECGEAEAHEEPNERILYAGENMREEKRLYAQRNRFTEEYLYSYRRKAYRLQGFGLWSVLCQGRVIGCCGFAPWDDAAAAGIFSERTKETKIILYHLNIGSHRDTSRRNTEEYPERNILEMQYMLDAAYRRQGFGTEMCRAALTYARERLKADEVRLRIREDNPASRALAEKLGFITENG